MRGISEIIAIVLMLLIVVGLAGTAFVYIQSSLVGNVAKQISVLDVSCVSSPQPGVVWITVKNLDPRTSFNASDLLIRWDNSPVALMPNVPSPNNWQPITLYTNNTVSVGNFTCASGVCQTGSSHTIKVIGPSNTQEKPVTC